MFCPTVIGNKYYWYDLSLSVRSISSKPLFEKAVSNLVDCSHGVCACV